MRLGRQMKRMLKKPRESQELAKGSMFLITVFLCLGLIITSQGVEDYFVSDLKINAQNLAKGYTHSLKKTVEASSAVRSLINEKLSYAVGIIADLSLNFSNEELRKIARDIDVDEIDVYDTEGKILYSNISTYLGWVAPEGHPVQNFLSSGLLFHLDPLRENTISKELVLYGYQRLADGRVIQVGVNVRHLEGLLKGSELDQMMMEMRDGGEALYVTYIDANRTVLGSSSGIRTGSYLPEKKEDQSLLEALRSGGFGGIQEASVYEVEEPVLLESVEAGKLVIGLSLDRTKGEIDSLNRIFTVVLVVIYLAAILMLYLYHYKNAKLYTMAYEDELTGLPNLKYFRGELDYLLSASKRNKMAVVLVELPRFSKITMSRGHDQVERLLAEMGNAFRQLEEEHLTFYRHSDEKFLVLLKNYETRAELVQVMETLSKISPSGEMDLASRYGSLRFGVLELRESDRTSGSVLKDAVIALNHAESHQHLQYSFFDSSMEKKVQRENQVEAALRKALMTPGDETVYLKYQPIIGKGGKKVSSAEALARLRTDDLGEVSPMEFIEVAEKNGLMGSLGKRILDDACTFSLKLQALSMPMKISVNISGLQMLEDDFIEEVKELLQRKEVPPSLLSFEITESVFLGNYDIINCKLKALKELGITISIDDFGTGYSSFARLKELYVDGVKIDRYFIRRISERPEEELISSDIIRMVHKYGLYTVAEGVETEKELSYLFKKSCDYIQGFYYSRPLDEAEFINFKKTFDVRKSEEG